MARFTRRTFVKAAASLATAAGLPMASARVAAVAGVDQKTVSNDLAAVQEDSLTDLPKRVTGKDGKSYPAPLCIHERIRAVFRGSELAGVEAAARAALSPEQWALHREYMDLAVEDDLADFDAVVAEYLRHFPGPASAMREIAYGACTAPGGACDRAGRPDETRYREVYGRLRGDLSHEQWRPANAHAEALTAAYVAELDRLGAAWRERLPGFAPALRCVEAHLGEQSVADRGACCDAPPMEGG